MSKRTASLRGVAIVALAAAALSLPMMSAAHAQTDTHYRARHTKIYNTTREPSTLSGLSRPAAPNAEPAFQDYPTWPEGSPNYHGGNG